MIVGSPGENFGARENILVNLIRASSESVSNFMFLRDPGSRWWFRGTKCTGRSDASGFRSALNYAGFV